MTERVLRWWDYPIFAVLTAANVAAVIYVGSYWFSGDNWSQPVTFVVLTLPLAALLAMFEARWFSLPVMRRPLPVPAPAGWKVGVATTFVPGAEPIEMLEKTVAALTAMDYPHDTWVLDEGDDPDVKALCARLGVKHFSRKRLQQYQTSEGRFRARTKYGNYNAWLTAVGFDRYEFVTLFDPDHVPSRDFLTTVLGYFRDPEIGYVQAAQVYYNQGASFIARGAAEETYDYYSSFQMSTFGMGFPIVVGCHNTHRVSALAEVGGVPPHDADDLLATLLYRVAGWRGVYVPRKLAVGLTPVDWDGYLRQQRRWARSVLDLKIRVIPGLLSRLGNRERLTALTHGLYYLQGLGIVITTALFAFMLATGKVPGVVSVTAAPTLLLLVAVVQVCGFYRQRFYLDPGREAGIHWRAAVLRAAKWPYVLIALYEALFTPHRPYAITRKSGGTRRRARGLVGPQLLVCATIVVALALGLLLDAARYPILDFFAGFAIVVSVALAATELLRFPEPFDPDLLEEPVPSSSRATRSRSRTYRRRSPA